MKNVVVFDKDTERDEVLIITKPDGTEQPTNEAEAKAMIISDISTATEGLMTLVQIANDSGYMDSDKSAKMIVDYFTKGFLTKETEKNDGKNI
jgi:hypothetical protein